MDHDSQCVDVHSHYFPDSYIELLAEQGVDPDPHQCSGLGAGDGAQEMSDRLRHMDEAGVEVQILSSSPLMPTGPSAAPAAHAARFINDLLVDLADQHPDRFRFVATLPMLYPDAALAEIERVADLDHLVGFAMTTSTAGMVLTDPLFLPVWQELDRRKACVILHPAGVNACSPLLSEALTWPVGSPIEDSVAVVQLIANAYPTRFPGVTIVNAHFGGVLPMVVDRLDRQLPHAVSDLPEAPSATAARMYYDTVGQGSVPAMQAAIGALGAERLLLGTDFPYQKDAAYVSAIDYVRAADLDATTKAGVLGGTARRLFGLGGTVTG